MKTTFLDLPYNPTGVIWSNGPHSSAYSPERRYPRTDLHTFDHWNEFETEIHQAITAHMANLNIPSEFDIGSMPKRPQKVSEEEDVRTEAKVQLHDLVVEVLEMLGIEGEFLRSGSGNNQVVGAPDFSWLRNRTPHPKIVVRMSLTSILNSIILWYRLSTRRNGRRLLQTCLGIFANEIRASWRDSQPMLCTNSTGT
jgi:hypothetical protein